MDAGQAASVVVPVFNQAAYTTICLASLAAADLGRSEVIVVDNGSTDGTPELLGRWVAEGPRRRVIKMPENTGFAGGCNAGARAAAYDLIVFLNNDTFVLAAWLSELLKPFGEPAVMITGSRLLYPNGRIQHAGLAFNEAGPHHIFAGLPADDRAVNEQRDWQAVTGAAMAIRASEFNRLGGFDEGYRNSFEDVDLCLRVRADGGRVVYVPKSVAYHFESVTEGRLGPTDDRNYRRFIERWQGRFESDLEPQVEAARKAGSDLDDRIPPKVEALAALRTAEETVADLKQQLSMADRRIELMETLLNSKTVQLALAIRRRLPATGAATRGPAGDGSDLPPS
ncbi:MAG: hypothetical protein NVS9B1_15850 [Candidatus Dormibacteraceae bacterium]